MEGSLGWGCMIQHTFKNARNKHLQKMRKVVVSPWTLPILTVTAQNLRLNGLIAYRCPCSEAHLGTVSPASSHPDQLELWQSINIALSQWGKGPRLNVCRLTACQGDRIKFESENAVSKQNYHSEVEIVLLHPWMSVCPYLTCGGGRKALIWLKEGVNETLVSIKCGEIFDHMSHCYLFS